MQVGAEAVHDLQSCRGVGFGLQDRERLACIVGADAISAAQPRELASKPQHLREPHVIVDLPRKPLGFWMQLRNLAHTANGQQRGVQIQSDVDRSLRRSDAGRKTPDDLKRCFQAFDRLL